MKEEILELLYRYNVRYVTVPVFNTYQLNGKNELLNKVYSLYYFQILDFYNKLKETNNITCIYLMKHKDSIFWDRSGYSNTIIRAYILDVNKRYSLKNKSIKNE